MCFYEDGSARCFIYAAALHTNNTVFYDIYDTDTMFAAQAVQFTDDVGNFHLFTIDRSRNTLFKSHSNIFALVRSLLWCNAQN